MPLFVHDGSLATVCEPRIALDFSAEHAKSQKALSQIYMLKLHLSARKTIRSSKTRKQPATLQGSLWHWWSHSRASFRQCCLASTRDASFQHWSKKIWFWMLFGCPCPLCIPEYEHLRPSHQEFLIFWPKFNMSWISSFLLRLWLLHRWLCRWHLHPNSEMQLWLQHLCLHILASNVELLFMPYDFFVGS